MDWTWLNGDLRHTDPNVDFENDALDIYKEYVDFAAEMGWEYQLLDEGWQRQNSDPDDDSIYKGYYDWTQELIDYANEKGVGLIVWANSADLDTPEEQEERITEWAQMGFKGVKPDFFDSQSQDTILQIENLMKVYSGKPHAAEPARRRASRPVNAAPIRTSFPVRRCSVQSSMTLSRTT